MLNLTNHFLVAMPNLNDELFGGSVVYVAKHTEEQGAIGVIINKPLGKKLKNTFKNLDFSKYNPQWSDSPLYLGGPINPTNGFVLCRTADSYVDGRLFELNNSCGALNEIATKSDGLFVSVGYSAWSSLQIESEIYKNDWLVIEADSDLLFNTKSADRYQVAMQLLGINNVSCLYAGGAVFA